MKRSVLIVISDLYLAVGGGQTAYRSIIENSPDKHFYYFADREAGDAPRPANTSVVRRKLFYRENVGDLPAEISHYYGDYMEAWQLARCFADAYPGVDLDVVDTPDFRTLGLFIRGALQHHGVRVGAVALAMHGVISDSISHEWGPATAHRSLAELRVRERLQYRSVDTRYAISVAYADEWASKSGGVVPNLIDPLTMVGTISPQLASDDRLPDLAFIGRREKRKGPDVFVDAVWSLDRASYSQAVVIGAESWGASGVGSESAITAMARLRNIEVDLRGSQSQADLQAYLTGPVIAITPSRVDSFNLVALEALVRGVPTFVSHEAGVARWISENLPELSDLVFRISGARELSTRLRAALADYSGLRQRVVDAVSDKALRADLSLLKDMYRVAHLPGRARFQVDDIRHRLDSFNRPRELDRPFLPSEAGENPAPSDPAATPQLAAWKRAILASPLRPAADFVHTTRVSVQDRLRQGILTSDGARGASGATEALLKDRSSRALAQLQAAENLESLRWKALHLPERTQREIQDKLRVLRAEAEGHLVARVAIFRELARLERKRAGGDIVAATYCMRIMRWLGEDQLVDLPFVTSALNEGGFHKEAVATDAMFGDPSRADQRIAQILQDQLASQKTKELGDFAIQDDRRGENRARVAVIVSLYNAASKLPGFLAHLASQTLMAIGEIEVILVDSGSPTEEYEAFKGFMADHDLPVLYVRTAQRETIQAAWNRGIQLAKAPYLSFLGVDEGVHPDTYAILAAELDAQPDLDWAMADSVITNVDPDGGYVSDVMAYRRAPYDQGLIQLETCYLSWVGGLYRRRIHDEIGYYDEAFRGAGDTEFKSRILPFAKSGHVPMLLGLFLNYPEERTTQHPRAEIEDQRAWYLYRTKAGVDYAWGHKPIGDVEDFFRHCLSYRKSFFDYQSTDFDMALAVARHMIARGANPKFAADALASAEAMIQRIQGLETLDMRLPPSERRQAVAQALVDAKAQELTDQNAFDLESRPIYNIVNDNRYEQHWYTWNI